MQCWYISFSIVTVWIHFRFHFLNYTIKIFLLYFNPVLSSGSTAYCCSDHESQQLNAFYTSKLFVAHKTYHNLRMTMMNGLKKTFSFFF